MTKKRTMKMGRMDENDSGEENIGDDDGQNQLDEEFGEEGVDYEKIPCAKFRASNDWRKTFRARHHLSIRRPHLKRRPRPNQAVHALLLSEIERAFEGRGGRSRPVPRRNIFNCDESNWKRLPNNMVTIAEPGGEGVTVSTKGNEKESRTIIDTISAAGEKLAMWAVKKGGTERCDKKSRVPWKNMLRPES
jgi:hypothetical protein